jgi:hypothetical protein
MNPLFDSLQLSISNKNLDCNQIISELASMGIMASVTKNKSIICDSKKNCKIEKGCRILFNRISRNELHHVWKTIHRNHQLSCAHIYAPPIFSGCILDFLRPSVCPGVKTDTSI